MKEVIYNNIAYKAEILIPGYATNGNTAIQLFDEADDLDSADGLLVSVNVDHSLPEEFVCIKNWSELSGIEQSLIDADIIEENPVNMLPSGFVRIPVYALTDTALNSLD